MFCVSLNTFSLLLLLIFFFFKRPNLTQEINVVFSVLCTNFQEYSEVHGAVLKIFFLCISMHLTDNLSNSSLEFTINKGITKNESSLPLIDLLKLFGVLYCFKGIM